MFNMEDQSESAVRRARSLEGHRWNSCRNDRWDKKGRTKGKKFNNWILKWCVLILR